MDTRKARVRLAAIGDIRYTRTSHGTLQPLCSQITESADVLLLCGRTLARATSAAWAGKEEDARRKGVEGELSNAVARMKQSGI